MRYKILEALACEIPIVSTTLGAQGIEANHCETMLLADDPPAFVQAVVTLLHNGELRKKLAHNGRALLQQRYTSTINTEHIRQVVEQLCNSEPVA